MNGYGRIFSSVPKKLTLKQARLSRGLTQQELAERSGIGQQSISKLERGRSAEPMFSTGLALANAVGVDPYRLTFGRQGVAA